jgi:hypothetical protein
MGASEAAIVHGDCRAMLINCRVQNGELAWPWVPTSRAIPSRAPSVPGSRPLVECRLVSQLLEGRREVLAGGMRRSIIALPVQAELLVLGCTASPWGVKKCPSALLIIESPSLVSRVGRNPNLMRALGWTGSVDQGRMRTNLGSPGCGHPGWSAFQV